MTDREFWHQRWQRGEIGFHRDSVHPALPAFWNSIDGSTPSRVIVPLAGKSIDMRWLAERGHSVTGIELDPTAVRSFFEDAGWTPRVDESGPLNRWQSRGVTLFQGDFFEFRAERAFERFYDRAALIALPADIRPRYLERLADQLAPGAIGLLVTLEYAQDRMNGPPFSVREREIAAQPWFDFECLNRENVLESHPRFAQRGVTRLHEVVYRLARRPVR
jgi:thiopurine S-methyltransferase